MDKLRPLGYSCPNVFLCRLITEIVLFSKGCVKKKRIYIYIYRRVLKTIHRWVVVGPALIPSAKNIDVRRRGGFTREVEQTWSWTGRMVEGENRPFICLTFLEVKNPWLLIQAAAVWSNIYICVLVRPPNICTWRWIRGDILHPWASKTVPVLPIHVMQKWQWFYRPRIASCYIVFVLFLEHLHAKLQKQKNILF